MVCFLLLLSHDIQLMFNTTNAATFIKHLKKNRHFCRFLGCVMIRLKLKVKSSFFSAMFNISHIVNNIGHCKQCFINASVICFVFNENNNQFAVYPRALFNSFYQNRGIDFCIVA